MNTFATTASTNASILAIDLGKSKNASGLDLVRLFGPAQILKRDTPMRTIPTLHERRSPTTEGTVRFVFIQVGEAIRRFAGAPHR